MQCRGHGFDPWASPVAQLVKNLPAMWETWVQSLGWENALAFTSLLSSHLANLGRCAESGEKDTKRDKGLKHNWLCLKMNNSYLQCIHFGKYKFFPIINDLFSLYSCFILKLAQIVPKKKKNQHSEWRRLWAQISGPVFLCDLAQIWLPLCLSW